MTEEKQEKALAVKVWPIEGATIRLAHRTTGDVKEFYDPPTFDGTIKIGMEATIFMPSLDIQKNGFTPYKLVDGEPVDATQDVLAHYAGIYKRVEEKGAK